LKSSKYTAWTVETTEIDFETSGRLRERLNRLYHQYQRQKIQNITEVDTVKHVFLILAKEKCPN
jgi:hypothetical protein